MGIHGILTSDNTMKKFNKSASFMEYTKEKQHSVTQFLWLGVVRSSQI